jgi:hypothetical protein
MIGNIIDKLSNGHTEGKLTIDASVSPCVTGVDDRGCVVCITLEIDGWTTIGPDCQASQLE